MERFAIKIDKKLKANLYKICRLCGIDNPDMVPIITEKPAYINETDYIDVEAELEMQQKINILLGLSITKDDRMPQTMCCLCVDKINDFYEFREMCYATNVQTRKLLGLKNLKRPVSDIKPKVEIKEESIVPTPIPAPSPASALYKNNKKRKSEEVAPKEEKQDITSIQLKKKLRFSTPESNIKEETQSKKKLRFSATNEEFIQPTSSCSKKSKNVTDDTKWKKESSPPVPASVPLTAVSNKKLRLAAPPQKDLAIKKSKQKIAKNMDQKEPEVKEEIKEEVKEEPIGIVSTVKALPVLAKVPAPPKLKFGCNICKERFSAKVNLETHRSTHIPKVERFVCTACNEILCKSFDIKNHQLWHKLSKTPYVCGCCGESILNTYAFSRHLREHAFDTPPALLVLDRECLQCHTTYATNFLYNIHACAVKTKRCAGCNRLQRNETEYLKHSALCAKVYLNYSRHIMPSVEALEDAVRIKNENDVEAAAEEIARISGVSLDMAPVVQLTRLSSPLIMAASQAVSSTSLDDAAASTSNKKSGKKGVSKKDLRRVDELLKSTLDALVSIKHEPEVHVDPEIPISAEHNDQDDHHESDDCAGGLDDFHYNNETDDENSSVIGAVPEQVKIKLEVDDTNEENLNKIGGGLKLKIKKEHGQLNSSIIEQQKSSEKRAEKRKKKKKHKEKEKDKHRLLKDTLDEQATNIYNNSSEENVGTSAVRIKVEPQDGTDLGEKSVTPVLQQRPQPEATIMTSIPMMQFQIACVSSGVEFNNSTNPTIETQNLASANHDPEPVPEPEDVKPNRLELDRMLQISHISSGIAMETGETEENLAERMVHDGDSDKRSGGEEKEEDDYYENDQHGDERESDDENDPDGQQEDCANNDEESANDTEVNKKNNVAKKTRKLLLQSKSKLFPKPKEQLLSIAPKSRNKACKSTAKPPNISTLQIAAVQSGIILESTTPTPSDFTPMFIKPEPLNRGYSDEQASVNIATPLTQHEQEENQDETEELAHAHSAEEQSYISTIDFNNITIKQEKEIEISEVQITQKSIKSIAKLNGIRRKRKQVKDNNEYMEEEDEHATDEDGEGNDSEDGEEEEEEEEEYDEDDEEMDEEAEHEEREYRELEYPPELTIEKNDTEDESKNNKDVSKEEKGSFVQETAEGKELKVSLVTANVRSQESTEKCEVNLTNLNEENIITKQVPAGKDTHILKISNISATDDLELTQRGEQGILSETLSSNCNEKIKTNTFSAAGTHYNINLAETNTNKAVLNIAEIQTISDTARKSNESTTENTHASIAKTLQTEENLGLLQPKAQSQQFLGQLSQDIQSFMQQSAKSIESNKASYVTDSEEHLQTALQSQHQLELQNTLAQSEEIQSTSQALLENLPHMHNSEVEPQSLSTPLQPVFEICSVRTTALNNTISEFDSCPQNNNDTCELSLDKENEKDDTATIVGVVQQSKDANLLAHPVTDHFHNESVNNDENEDDYNEDIEEENEIEEQAEEESTLFNNLEERQNYQNQEVLSQIKPTALALHPYLEDISSSSNSLLSNSLSQTPPPPPLQRAASATGVVNNNLNSQRLLNTEETENILNESNEVAETSAMSVSHSLIQPILGQPLPPQMPTFNFDNINEIAENNNNANIEREQLQDEQHLHQNN